MAAYAALVSIFNIMEQIQIHPRHSFSFDNNQMQSLRQNVDFLLDFMENYSHEETEALESQITAATRAAEDVIETHVVDQIHDGSSLNREAIARPCFLVDLQKAIEEMDSVKEIAKKVKVQRGSENQRHIHSRPAAISSNGKNVMVGFDDELIQLVERLTRPQQDRRIIPIVGMGGIGKTTLARNVYQHSLIVHHFDVRLWATVSQDYSAEKILSELLSGQKGTVHELGEQLHKSLSGRRYLIVLDDMWSIEAWDEIQLFLPDNGNGSRIVVSTRQTNMAIQLSSFNFVMNFLDEDKSWKLFCGKAFGDEGCPPELEEIGKKIVRNCEGLPLSIIVVGGHLGKSSRMNEYWEEVANDINLVLNSGDDEEQCLNILSLSYSYLPVHLKPCFLYLGVFVEDKEIRVSKLIKLWVAEGFLKADNGQCLEEVAECYFRDLVDRNLVLVPRGIVWKRSWSVTFTIHDLVRELCTRVAEKEKFFRVVDSDTPRDIHMDHRVIHKGMLPREESHPLTFRDLESAQLVRSLKWKTGEPSFHSKLLRVLNQDYLANAASTPIDDYFQQVNLRYFDYYPLGYMYGSLYLPSSISRLWNLQTLKIRGEVTIPSEIWEMPQLRHVELDLFRLPDPLRSDKLDRQDDFVLQNLQTLMDVKNFRMSEEVCKRIPNIKELRVRYNDYRSESEASSYYCPHNLSCFHKLESLLLSFFVQQNWRGFVQRLIFPSSLRELVLQCCRLHWEDLTVIGMLPHLEVLELGWNSVEGREWNPVEDQFHSLKYLEIRLCNDLICWNAERAHFPVLEELILNGMWQLDEIPSGIGGIPTLAMIRLHSCSVSAAFSALKILVEQEEFENEEFRLEVFGMESKDKESFRETMQLEGLTSNNFHLY